MDSEFHDTLSKFEPVSLLTTVSAVSVYPPNALFLTRFRFLVAEIASVESFSNEKTASVADVIGLLNTISQPLSDMFEGIEDYEPCSIFDEIAICSNGSEKRFFYADLERPFPSAENLVDQSKIITSIVKRKMRYRWDEIVKFLFSYQDYLVKSITTYFTEIEEVALTNGKILAPSNAFLEFWQLRLCSSIADYQPFVEDKPSWRRWRLQMTTKSGLT